MTSPQLAITLHVLNNRTCCGAISLIIAFLKNIILFCVQLNRAVEKLLAKAGDILNVAKSDGFTTLHIAAVNDHREIAKILLKQVDVLIIILKYM